MLIGTFYISVSSANLYPIVRIVKFTVAGINDFNFLGSNQNLPQMNHFLIPDLRKNMPLWKFINLAFCFIVHGKCIQKIILFNSYIYCIMRLNTAVLVSKRYRSCIYIGARILVDNVSSNKQFNWKFIIMSMPSYSTLPIISKAQAQIQILWFYYMRFLSC